MAKNKDSISYIFTVAFLVCLVCAVIVSTAAVSLRPLQQKNKEVDLKSNILAAAGLLEDGKSVEESFSQIETRLVDIDTGMFSDAFDVDTFDPVKAVGDASITETLDKSVDIAGLKRREKYTEVYLVRDAAGEIETLILPIRGYGLWSTLWGFVALESDFNTVVGLGFYSHAETPGLGGEVDNPSWKAQWSGKKITGDDGELLIEVTKGGKADPDSDYQVDGLSGATLTTNGVSNLVRFWLGENGFEPLINNLKAGGA
ncbi:Na(+)-translocating NADH-quinone reductase subunit C [Reinekea marinisedimentorum]|uniref:Na(+)-translocating NADH-quinone reductase subunit C n=1 Tax=Reinekea marinisedimentorum TaxID=230495 RepID=A0A4R3IBH9_9GAMM|nr:Na(+)-translocating NADH-quinone reductase subunit C [Reinekea marinisedimentorum]TCS42631.1 Na+-transporting NADH:ubiquinone oxidoreductase subunit C [Reinekea marinisedimentorum]